MVQSARYLEAAERRTGQHTLVATTKSRNTSYSTIKKLHNANENIENRRRRPKQLAKIWTGKEATSKKRTRKGKIGLTDLIASKHLPIQYFHEET
jgi:phosphopantetheinyl transferase (holo-ACP synthase)